MWQSDGSGAGAWVSASLATSVSGLSDVLVEDFSMYIGNDPSSTTNGAFANVSVGPKALNVITTGDNNVAVGYDAMENITYTADNYLPGVDPETGQLNGSVRSYGTWRGTNTASGKDFEILMYHYFTFNEDGKIINSGDFGDATGLMMAVAADVTE